MVASTTLMIFIEFYSFFLVDTTARTASIVLSKDHYRGIKGVTEPTHKIGQVSILNLLTF